MGVKPDGIVGHSTGEMGCAYADGCLTAEQTMKLAYHRGATILAGGLDWGAMAAIGLSWEEVKARLPEGLTAACHNAAESVTVSGEKSLVDAFVEKLAAEGIFARSVNSAGVPFHSPAMQTIKPALAKAFGSVITDGGKPRSPRWVSSSIAEAEWDDELAETSSAEYHVNNTMSPVLFHEALSKVRRRRRLKPSRSRRTRSSSSWRRTRSCRRCSSARYPTTARRWAS